MNVTKINEILAGIILYCIVSYILALNHLELALLFVILGSHINVLLPKNYKHGLIIYLPLIVVLLYSKVMGTALITGYSASILIGLLSKEGCKLLYPFKSTTFTGPSNYLENNSKKDYAATTFLVTLMIIALIFSSSGEEIIDSFASDNLMTYNNSDFEANTTGYPIHYININPSSCVNKNITTFNFENGTTTLITNYSPS